MKTQTEEQAEYLRSQGMVEVSPGRWQPARGWSGEASLAKFTREMQAFNRPPFRRAIGNMI